MTMSVIPLKENSVGTYGDLGAVYLRVASGMVMRGTGSVTGEER